MVWTAEQILQVTGGRLLRGDPHRRCPGIQVDSRNLQPGQWFWALPGRRQDGHAFVWEALRKGAGGVVVQEGRALDALAQISRADRRPWIQVPDTLRALQELARAHRIRLSGVLVGVTGSNGKTTTKEILASLLGVRGSVWATPGNRNSQVGLGLSLLEAPSRARYLVAEMGISAPGEMERLCAMALPSAGIVTRIGEAHTEGLGDRMGVARAKRVLLQSLPPGGLAVVNRDDPFWEVLIQGVRAPVRTFAIRSQAHVRILSLKEDREGGIPRGWWAEMEVLGHRGRLWVPLPGLHNLYNALAAITVTTSWGWSLQEVAEGLSRVQPPPHRMAFRRRGHLLVVDDSYNANPDSMLAALEVLQDLEWAGIRAAVLGDMKELGPQAPEFHRRLGGEVVRRGITFLVAVGEFASWMAQGALEEGMPREAVRIVAHPREVLEALGDVLSRPAVVLVKGSRALGLEQVVEALEQGPEEGE